MSLIINENNLELINNSQEELITENYALEILGLKNPADFRKFSRSFIKLDDILKKIDSKFGYIGLLLGKEYRGVYSYVEKYYQGNIYYKKNSNIVSFEIPNGSNTKLKKENQVIELKRFYKLINGMEKEFNITSNDDNSVVGFEIGDYLNLDRINSAITFELPIITNVVAVEFQATNSADLIKTITLSENTPTPTITKTQRDRPLTSSLTQRETNLRKFNY